MEMLTNYSKCNKGRSSLMNLAGIENRDATIAGLSESFEVDGQVVKVSGQHRDILFKKMPFIKEMPSRVAGLY